MLSQHTVLTVSQQVEPYQVISNLETENRYRVVDQAGEAVLFANEESGFMSRQFLRSHRAMTLTVADSNGEVHMTAKRGRFWFFSHLDLLYPDGSPIGKLERRFALFGRRFTLTDVREGSAEIHGPITRPHTFWVRRNGAELAKITKEWGGVARELVTVADHFKVEFTGAGVAESLRWLIIGAAFAIDYDFFEDRRTLTGGIRPGTLGGHSHDTGGFTGRGF
jgi:uncharacterized protein YxjI